MNSLDPVGKTAKPSMNDPLKAIIHMNIDGWKSPSETRIRNPNVLSDSNEELYLISYHLEEDLTMKVRNEQTTGAETNTAGFQARGHLFQAAFFTLTVFIGLFFLSCTSFAATDFIYNDIWACIPDDEFTHLSVSYIGGSSSVTVPAYIPCGDSLLPVVKVSFPSHVTFFNFILDENDYTPCREVYGPSSDSGSPITSITLPEGVTTVGGFQNCSQLKTVHLSSTVTKLDYSAFLNCSSLDTINLDHVFMIDSYALQGTALKSVTLPEGMITVAYQAFCDCKELETVVMADTITSIEYGGFSGCSALTSVTFSNGLLSVGRSAFMGCTSLTEVDLPDTVTSLGDHSFSNCSALKRIHLSSQLVSMGGYDFQGCLALTELTLPSSLKDIFNGTSSYDLNLTKLVMEDGIGVDTVPYNLPELTELYAPVNVVQAQGYDNTVTGSFPKLKIAVCANTAMISGCKNTLEELTLLDPNQNYNTLRNHTHLHSLTLPEGLTTLPDYAFQGCSALQSVNLPSSLTSIGDYAFSGCPIAEITIPENVPSINYTFENNTALRSVVIPSNVQSMTGAFRGCTALETASLQHESRATSLAYTFAGCTSLHEIWIPTCFTNLSHAFDGCSSLSNVMMAGEGDAITTADSAFEGCVSLYDIDISERLTNISIRMFAGSGLETVNFRDSSTVTSIGAEAFRGCEQLWDVGLSSAIQSIGNLAFADCPSLHEMDVPDTVTSFARNAVENDRIDLIVTQGSSAWYAAVSSFEDGIEPVFRDQIVLLGGELLTPYEGNIELLAPGADPEGNYDIYFLLESTDGTYSQLITGVNRMSAIFSNLDLEHKDYIARIFVGYDFSSIDTTNKQIRPGYNGAMTGPMYYDRRDAWVDGTGNIRYAETSDDFVLPSELGQIESEAFDGAALSGRFVVCPAGLTSIGENAFASSGIESIYLPESVQNIGDDAFSGSQVTVYCVHGSWAEGWAEEHGFLTISLWR